MKKQLFSLLLLISFVGSVSAQATKQATVKPDAIEQNLRKHVAYLASDRLEGRRTGERGATFAAGYVANVFSGLKLKGGFAETANGKTKISFLQPFPFVTGIELAKTGNEFRISIANSPAGQTLQTDNLASWKALAFSPNATVDETPIVFAGYGITSEEAKADDYAGLEVTGKIALVFDGTPDSTGNPHSPFARFDARAKAKIARDKGARALFIISRSQRLEGDQLFGVRYDASLGESAVPVILVSRRTAAALLGKPEGELSRVETLAQTRSKGELTDLRAAMRDTLQSRAAFQINLAKKEAEAYNVIGILEGSDPALKNEAVVIGAHYDHLGRGGAGSLAANSRDIHHGADDNASGVAALLELARQFSQEKKNKRTIIFIAFGGEESGLLGSKHYINNPVFPLDKTVAMINLDMVGRLNDGKLTIGGVGTASEWRELISSNQPTKAGKMEVVSGNKTNTAASTAPTSMPIVVGTNGQPVVTRELDSPVFNLQLNEDGFGPSDHSSFYGKQIPVLFFFTGTHADYHKPSDTAEKINYEGLKQIVSLVSDIAKAVDRNPKRPTYAQAKSAGMMGGGRTGFNVSLGTIPSYAESSDGLVLDGVREASPAAKAGLKAGDKIVRLAGKEVRNVSDYTFVLGEMKPDVEYEVVIVRSNQRLTLKIIPAARK